MSKLPCQLSYRKVVRALTRTGFKFNDADLIGFPVRVVVGKKGLADGIVEVHNRKTGETNKVAPGEVPKAVTTVLQM